MVTPEDTKKIKKPLLDKKEKLQKKIQRQEQGIIDSLFNNLIVDQIARPNIINNLVKGERNISKFINESKIDHVNLSDKNIGKRRFGRLAKHKYVTNIIKKCDNLEYLDLSNNGINREQAMRIIKAKVESGRSDLYINLAGNELENNKSFMSYCETFATNISITQEDEKHFFASLESHNIKKITSAPEQKIEKQIQQLEKIYDRLDEIEATKNQIEEKIKQEGITQQEIEMFEEKLRILTEESIIKEQIKDKREHLVEKEINQLDEWKAKHQSQFDEIKIEDIANKEYLTYTPIHSAEINAFSVMTDLRSIHSIVQKNKNNLGVSLKEVKPDFDHQGKPFIRINPKERGKKSFQIRQGAKGSAQYTTKRAHLVNSNSLKTMAKFAIETAVVGSSPQPINFNISKDLTEIQQTWLAEAFCEHAENNGIEITLNGMSINDAKIRYYIVQQPDEKIESKANRKPTK